MPFSIQEALKGITDPEELKTVVDRLQRLSVCMINTVQLTVRDDSKLAWSYITNSLSSEWSLDRVVYELALTHYLYNYTPYPKLLQESLNMLANSLENPFPPNYVRDFLIPQCKAYALSIVHADGKFPPAQWPWVVVPPPPSQPSTPSDQDAQESDKPYDAIPVKLNPGG